MDVVLQLHAGVQRDVVLDLDVIADMHPRRHMHVLSEDALLPNMRVFHDVREVPDLRAAANFARRVHDGGRMHVVRPPLAFVERHRLPMGADRFPGSVQHAQNLQAILSVGSRSAPLADAFQEVAALQAQRLLAADGHYLAFRPAGNRHAINPIDAMRIED
jgi:hypothetical protein